MLSYTIDGISGSKAMVRTPFGGGFTKRDVGNMWWGGSSENGWGINIAQHDDTLFSVWYTYGIDKKSQWFVMSGGSWNNNTYSGPFYSTTGSRWLGAAYDSSALRVAPVGSMILNFTNPDLATFNYVFLSGPFAGTSQTKTITRLGY